jgi:hypothetical protein
MPLTWWLKTEKREELTKSKTITVHKKLLVNNFVENWSFPFLMVRKIFGEYLLWFHFVNGYEISLNFNVP